MAARRFPQRKAQARRWRTDKNRAGREFPLTPELVLILKEQHHASKIEKARNVTVASVFFWEDGTRIKSYRAGWDAAVKASGIQRVPHDFRRTAVRHPELAGVPRSTAMKMVRAQDRVDLSALPHC